MISTHILDLTTGDPASNVAVTLQKLVGEQRQVLAEQRTNEDGRIAFDVPAEAGTYTLIFHIDDYLADAFFTVAPVTFHITDTSRKYHIPLLLSAFGYSTYRGS